MSFKSVIAVASGKGGVGKSTTAVNLAVNLERLGARVGLLDADIYGPNIPMMMGVKEDRAAVTENQELIPFIGQGVKVMSIAFLVEAGKAIIWRGPMLHNLIRQFLTKVIWGDLDYLIVDLPPGTGDAPLSLVQSVPLTGAIVVTTPQQVSLSDVRRSIAMFQEVKVPVLGLVENMSGFYCAELGKVVPMFHGEGGKTLSAEYHIPLLGQVPFDPAVGDGGDTGVPISLSKPDSVQAKAFYNVAQHVQEQVKTLGVEAPKIEVG
jgi:ATP-binding protein involved in chromosome partitioning